MLGMEPVVADSDVCEWDRRQVLCHEKTQARLYCPGCAESLRHCVRVAKEMDSKSIGLWPQGFESPRCRIGKLAGKWHLCLCAALQPASIKEQFGYGCRALSD